MLLIVVWRTWANGLSLSRLVIAPFTFLVIIDGSYALGLALFCFAVITDAIDGPIARKSGNASPLGGKLDHGADAIYVTLCLTALAYKGFISWALPPLVIIAFLQYLFDSHALKKEKPLRSSQLGRYNGIAYFVLVGIPLVQTTLSWSLFPPISLQVLSWLLIATTIISMLNRLASGKNS